MNSTLVNRIGGWCRVAGALLPRDQIDHGAADSTHRPTGLAVALRGLDLTREFVVLNLTNDILVMAAAARSVEHMI